MDLAGRVLPSDHTGVEARVALLDTSAALYDSDLDDVPDGPVRAVDELASLAAKANEECANSRYSLSGKGLGTLLTELHIQAVKGNGDTRRAALRALAEARWERCPVASQGPRKRGETTASYDRTSRTH